MATPVLVIGNKNYSSWSLRAWLLMKVNGIAFDEVRVPLYQQHSTAAIAAHARASKVPYTKVPILHDGDVVVWDSLSICEYVAERWPQTRGWPDDRRNRAIARAVSAEMHAGFSALRNALPMNCRRAVSPAALTPDVQLTVQRDIDRIVEIWRECRETVRGGGPFLFGEFGIADAMYAPVVLRFSIYQVPLPALAQDYVETVLQLPSLREWMAAGRTETEVVPQFER